MRKMDKPLSNIEQRLTALRAELAERGLAGFVIPLTDEHQSEYVADYAQRLAWISGFTGSAGSAVVMATGAAVFVDGRYTLQVKDQVDGALYERLGVPESPLADWLKTKVKEGDKVGYDPFLHTAKWVEKIAAALAARGAELVAVAGNPIDAVWSDQPAEPLTMVRAQDIEFAGESSADKRARLAEDLGKKDADASVLTALDSIAWLFNIRAQDVLHTPVSMAFAILHADSTAELFIAPEKVDADLQAHLGNAVTLRAKQEFPGGLENLGIQGKAVLVDPDTASAAVFSKLENAGAKLVKDADPCALPKARKNAAEIKGTQNAHIRDGVAVTRFLHWLAGNAHKGGVDEISAADKLLAFRQESPDYRDSSFDTISGSGPNGAIVHYRVSPESNLPLKPGWLYLVDSGAQYLDGTTDITRTLAIGAPDEAAGEEERNRYTLVLKGHIALASCLFPKGTTGPELDSFARRPLWQAGLDYDHGTGHGVGSYLAVHEGPGRIAKTANSIALEPGMIFSNEPGYYKTGAYGIRIENLVLVKSVDSPGDREMMEFEELTLVPLERKLIDSQLLSAEELSWLNAYHARVREVISPLVPEDTREWLARETAPVN
jgi:Xaa-Pro aminopeptidase